jgi:hypothetical protein
MRIYTIILVALLLTGCEDVFGNQFEVIPAVLVVFFGWYIYVIVLYLKNINSSLESLVRLTIQIKDNQERRR